MISAAAKIFAVLLNRISVIRDSRAQSNQGGFRPGRGFVDQIFILRRILEYRFKYQQPVVACFIDFRAAFDSIDRNALWKVMLYDGAPEKLIQLIKPYYTSARARVRTYGEESCEFDLCSGVRQGCPSSLFNYAIDWIMTKAIAEYRGVRLVSDIWFSNIKYADDVVILAEKLETLNF